MKTKKTSVKQLMADVLLIGAVALAERINSSKPKPTDTGDEEKAIQRKVSTAHIIYHAIGIFYNE